tara:strand:+ start:3128 stop:3640 length:513 start_codon:yes stop_codon:yes gene_type:complete
MQKITLVAAIDSSYGIGYQNSLPWHIPEDLKQFKNYTLGKPMIMGRKSFEGLNSKPLPGRPTTVISRTLVSDSTDFLLADNLQQALSHYPDADEIIIAGGTRVYKEALSVCTHMRLTHIGASFKVDTYFPKFDKNQFIIEEQSPLTCITSPKLNIEIITYRQIDNTKDSQ